MLTLFILVILGSALALGALRIGVLLVWYLLLAVGRWKMFGKMGRAGWKGFIPIYSDYVLYDACWKKKFFWLALIASVICASRGDAETASALTTVAGVVGAVLEFFLMRRVSRAFGHGLLYTIGLLLFSPLFILYLGFGPDRFRRRD